MRVSTGLICSIGFAAIHASAAAGKEKSDAHIRKIAYDYARCVIKAEHRRAAEAIIANADNQTIEKKYPDLIIGECLKKVSGPGALQFGGDQYRYALANALVAAEFKEKGESDFANRLPLAHLRIPDKVALESTLAKTKSKRRRKEIQNEFDNDATIAALSKYGECIVRNDPERSRLWLLTSPDGPEETSRINDLRPSFSQCLVGGTAKFSRSTMRGVVAINYFRLAHATAQPTSERTH